MSSVSSSSSRSSIAARKERRGHVRHQSEDSMSSRSSRPAGSPSRDGVNQVPPAPEDLRSEISRERVNLSDAEMVSFRNFARGTGTEARLRETWFGNLPMVNDVSAMAPRLDRKLKGKDMKIVFTENQAIQHHEGLYAALNLLTLSSSSTIRGTEQEITYRERTERVLSVLIHDLTVARRVAALDSLKVPVSEIPGAKRRTLDLKAERHPHLDDERIHNLFPADMVREIKDAIKEKDTKKAAPRLAFSSWVKLGPSSKIVPATRQFAQENWPKFRKIDAPLEAGRLRYFACNWASVTSDSWVLRTVKGYSLPLRKKITSSFRSVYNSTTSDPLIRAEAAKLLEKRAIFEIKASEAVWISPIFLVPKKDGGQRPVINLKALNLMLRSKHFKMENLLLVKDLLSPGAFMAKLDMQDAYFGIPIKNSSRKYLAFEVDGITYAFRALPFGLATAPRVYTKVIKPVASFLRARGIRLIVYLDDWLFIAETAEQLAEDLRLSTALFKALGLIVNEQKSQLTPVQQIEFLGLNIDSCNMTFSVPLVKQEKIKSLANELLESETIPARKISKLCGMLASVKLACNFGALKARYLQRSLKGVGPTTADFDKKLKLLPEAEAEAIFWSTCAASKFSKNILSPEITHVVRTDASLRGWGCSYGSLRTGGRWTADESKMHINVLELKAALLGLQVACKMLFNVGVRLETDNAVTAAYINKKGGTRSKLLLEAAQALWSWAFDKKIFVVASHIPGITNIIADEESRNFRENCEWQLDMETISHLFLKWGTPEVDLFASRLNNQCRKYYSLRADPGAIGTDAFAHSWRNLKAYAFPPFCLAGKVLQKALGETKSLILITPAWPSSAIWPRLQAIAEGPLLIQNCRVRSPSSEIKLNQNIHFAAWFICFSLGSKYN
uniref:Reverse transcriptase domain-containing protein n=1 Tax=Panagrolaimus superbus TaxID=310955 RepID=A0A914YX61_9BILA